MSSDVRPFLCWIGHYRVVQIANNDMPRLILNVRVQLNPPNKKFSSFMSNQNLKNISTSLKVHKNGLIYIVLKKPSTEKS